MDSKILWRVILILVVVALSVWSLYPPGEKIHYGLDLSGGIHLVLQVQTDDAIKAELDDSAQRLVSRAQEQGLTLSQGESNIDNLSFTVNVPADTDTAALRELAEDPSKVEPVLRRVINAHGDGPEGLRVLRGELLFMPL